MTIKIRRAAVLGAGVMGAQIAAHLAAAGIRTHVLDLVTPKDFDPKKQAGKDKRLHHALKAHPRSAPALLAIHNLGNLKPSPLMSKDCLANIIPGNFDDDMSVLADCDWVIEAVIERIDIKKKIHKQIQTHARQNVPVTTNTSGISLAQITEDLPDEYNRRFFGTHFFNPPRYMHLLEIIPHENCDKNLMVEMTNFMSARLGKGIVFAKDTVNFIANRIGVFASQCALKHMAELKLNIETVDALTGPLIGRAKSATFRTMDVVGLDTFAAVSRNTYERAAQDPYREIFLPPKWLEDMIERGHLGQKTGSVGCYKKSKDAKGKTLILAFRPEGKTYTEQTVEPFPCFEKAQKERDTIQRIRGIIEENDDGAEFVWRNLRDLFSYSAMLLSEIADGLPKSVDDAIRFGFNYEFGPFELWQALGYETVLKRMQKDIVPLPSFIKPGLKFYSPEPLSVEWIANAGPKEQLTALTGASKEVPRAPYRHALPPFENKEDPRVVLSNKGASLVDIGHGVCCLNFHTKMNTIDYDITDMLQKSVAKVSQDFEALVIGNEGKAFSAGANIKLFMKTIDDKKWQDLDGFLREFQGTMQLLKFAPFPTISCPHGLTLGGGCEVALHTTERLVAGETYAGLVEMGVGLIPAGGGTKELALRAYERMAYAERGDPSPFLAHAFMLIGMARVSTSGQDAMENGLFPESTSVSLSKEHLIERAKHLALEMVHRGYLPKIPVTELKVVGDPGIQTFKLMLYNMVQGRQISEYDAVIGEKIATVLCGGEVDPGTLVSEQYLLDLERRVFIELCQQQKTRDRIEHMLKAGQPLRN